MLFWFDIKGSVERYEPQNFPIFIWELQGVKEGMYGFPAVDGQRGGIKIASEQYVTETTPGTVSRDVRQEEISDMYENFIKPYFPDLSDHCIRAISCLYTVTPDSHFVIDTHPQHRSLIIASPCSGHGFKHSAAIGEVLAELAMTGKSTIDISSFGLDRLSKRS